MKKLIPLLVLAIVLAAAPAAMATHCDKCKLVMGELECAPAFTAAWETCIVFGDVCHVEVQCSPGALPEPLEAEYTVASVERLDEPDVAESETLVASLQTPEHTDR